MPAFTFEKISTPVRSTTAPVPIKGNARSIATEPAKTPSRGLVVTILDKLSIVRIKRDSDHKA